MWLKPDPSCTPVSFGGPAPHCPLQYSYTERFRPLAEHLGGPHHEAAHSDHNKHGSAKHQPMATTVLPGVFWVYDLSAFMVQISQVL